MVAVLFVVSGYVDSMKALRAIHRREWEQLQRQLAFAVLKRGPRLFMPSFLAAVLIAVAVWFGLYEWKLEYRLKSFDGLPTQLQHHESLSKQFYAMWQSFAELLDLWHQHPVIPVYNIHMWSLPYELRASFARYLTILAVSRLGPISRMAVLTTTIGVMVSFGRWELALSLSGVLLCEFDMLSGIHVKPHTELSKEKKPRQLPRSRSLTSAVVLLASLYLSSYPKQKGAETPLFQTLATLVPSNWEDHQFWTSIASVMLIWVVMHSRVLAKILEASVLQYLGGISFSIYLLHGPILHMTAYALIPIMWDLYARTLGKTIAFLLPTLFVVVPTLCLAAHLFRKFVELPCYWIIDRILYSMESKAAGRTE